MDRMRNFTDEGFLQVFRQSAVHALLQKIVRAMIYNYQTDSPPFFSLLLDRLYQYPPMSIPLANKKPFREIGTVFYPFQKN